MPNQTPGQPSDPPPSRRDRREAARRDRRLASAGTTTSRPAWRSPSVLISLGAVAAGLLLVLVASGVLGGRNSGSDDLLVPIRPTPSELADAANPLALAVDDPTVTVEVWSDYQCPACGLWAKNVEPDVIEEFVRPGTVRLVYRDFAFLDGGARSGESHQAAAAARCAGEQGSFWPYHDYLYENQDGENEGAFRRERLDLIATTLDLDMDAFGSCMASDAPFEAVEADLAAGRQAGVGSTPTIAVNGVLQRAGVLTLDDVRAAIETALAASSPAP
jgi:protein-disulfide isomerase